DAPRRPARGGSETVCASRDRRPERREGRGGGGRRRGGRGSGWGRGRFGAGVGAGGCLRVGAGVDPVASRPVHIRGRVRGTPSGKLRISGPSWQDAPVDLGVTAVVDVDEGTIVTSGPGPH